MKPTGTIDYEALAQDAMRGVIATILKTTEQSGLPGEHHFYISFDTNASGVNISKRLRQQYPDVMTIVLQHRFWDLAVSDTYFEVKLTFDSIPERLVIPYKAIKVFFDPSVRYALQFDAPDFDNTGAPNGARGDGGELIERPTQRSLTPVQDAPVQSLERAALTRTAPALVPIGADAATTDGSDDQEPPAPDEKTDNSSEPSDIEVAAASTTVPATVEQQSDNIRAAVEPDLAADQDASANAEPADDNAPEQGNENAEEDEPEQSAVVVSLDAFRKK